MNKICTDLEQSKVLSKILPLENADMCYRIIVYNPNDTHVYQPYCFSGTLESDIPCWSLSALLGVLPEIQGSKPIIALDDNYITYPHINDLHTKADNLIDACFEMIIKLNELKML